MILMKGEEEKCLKLQLRAQGKNTKKLMILLRKLRNAFNKNNSQTLVLKLKVNRMKSMEKYSITLRSIWAKEQRYRKENKHFSRFSMIQFMIRGTS